MVDVFATLRRGRSVRMRPRATGQNLPWLQGIDRRGLAQQAQDTVRLHMRPGEKLRAIHETDRRRPKGKLFSNKNVDPALEPALERNLKPPSSVEPAIRILSREQLPIHHRGTVSPSQLVSNLPPRGDTERLQSVLVRIRRTGCSLPCSRASMWLRMPSFRPECSPPRHRFSRACPPRPCSQLRHRGLKRSPC